MSVPFKMMSDGDDEAVGAGHEGPVLSVVAPVWNEVATIPLFYDRCRAVLDSIGEPWELILVDDGSVDGSRDAMRALAATDPRVCAVILSRNFGHQIAITAGLDHACGEAVVVIDSDLQDPPEVIGEMVEQWRAGYQVVYGMRIARVGETWFKRTTASAFYRLIRQIASVDIPLDTGDFRLMDRVAADALRSMREHHRFVRGMAAWIGYRTTAVHYARAARHAGETKYPLRKMARLAIDGITNFSYLPLQLATYAGFLVAGLSLVGVLAAVVVRVFLGHELTGQATTLVSVLFLGGIQLIFLGVIGEYLGRIYDEVKGRPLYLLDRVFGANQANSALVSRAVGPGLASRTYEPTRAAPTTASRNARAIAESQGSSPPGPRREEGHGARTSNRSAGGDAGGGEP